MRKAVATLEHSPARLRHACAPFAQHSRWRAAGHDELEATGEKLWPLLASGVESLTPPEPGIATTVAEWHSNCEMTQTPFLTVRTVETHLSNAYRELDIESRTELPHALARTTLGAVAAQHGTADGSSRYPMTSPLAD